MSSLTSAALRLPRGGVDVAGVAALAVLVRVLYGPGAVGYDAGWALLWGREIGRGELPTFEAPFAPTPHPLSNLVFAPVSWLGDAAVDAVLVISAICFAALVWLAFRLGSQLFSLPVGILLGAIILTRPTLVTEAGNAFLDIPFLALVLAAAYAEARRPRNWPAVLALLGLAGLLRPEAWLLAVAYVAYLWPAAEPRVRMQAALLALAAPVLWSLTDLIVTGDPLHSLHGTRELAARRARPTELGQAAEAAPGALQDILGTAVVSLGFAGALLALTLLYRRALLPGAIAALGLGSFLVLGIAGLPVLTRYLLLPALILALFACVAAFGWVNLPEGARARRLWGPAAALIALPLLALSVPSVAGDLRDLEDHLAFRHRAHGGLERVLAEPRARATVARCDQVAAPEYPALPHIAFWLDRPAASIRVQAPRPADGTAYVSYTSQEVARLISLSPRRAAALPLLPPDLPTVGRNAWWIVWARC